MRLQDIAALLKEAGFQARILLNQEVEAVVAFGEDFFGERWCIHIVVPERIATEEPESCILFAHFPHYIPIERSGELLRILNRATLAMPFGHFVYDEEKEQIAVRASTLYEDSFFPVVLWVKHLVDLCETYDELIAGYANGIVSYEAITADAEEQLVRDVGLFFYQQIG